LDILGRVGTDVTSDFRRQIQAKIVIPDESNQNSIKIFQGVIQSSQWHRELTTDLTASGNFKLNKDLGLRVLVGHNFRQRLANKPLPK
jgi:hypothetical protein